ncbi:MAG TPA: hypothetical protein ENK91_09745 [Bacteroidetes bacterium]|nr:hypothetical protein [Bacteroidota bacterium]
MKKLIFVLGLFVIFSCNNSTGTKSNSKNFAADQFDLENLIGTDVKKAIKFDKDGNTVEEGFVKNGKKEGEWIEYNPKDGKIISITSYIDGKLNGKFIEFDNRGYLVKTADFKNDQLDGRYVKYKYNKIIEEANYENGKLNGIRTKYFDNNGKKQEEVEYKDDVIDGIVRYYDDKGELTIEYTYKNGKKVSGGMVNPGGDNPVR